MRSTFPDTRVPHFPTTPVLRFALAVVMAAFLTPLLDSVSASDERDIVLRTSRALDGRGAVLEDRDIVV